MSFLLDIVGSFIIGGIVILILISLNIEMTENSRRAFENTYLQRTAVSASETIEYDFYKIGYNVDPDSAVILWADEEKITFFSDIDNTGVIDSIKYFVGDSSETGYSQNPNDYPLYRKKGIDAAIRVCNVTSFNLEYFDESGNELFPVGLAVSQAARDEIRSIKVNFIVEAYDPIYGIITDEELKQIQEEDEDVIYEGAEYQKTIKLKNLFR